MSRPCRLDSAPINSRPCAVPAFCDFFYSDPSTELHGPRGLVSVEPQGPSAACTLGHFMLPILHFRPDYGSNGWSGGAPGAGSLREIWRSRPRYASDPGQIMG
jgi:hypothetical protein